MIRARRRSIVAVTAPMVAAVLALAPLAAALLPPTSAAAATDDAGASIQVRLASLRPVAPQPNDTLTLSGSITNVSDATVTDLALDLEISSAVTARSDFDTYGSDPDGPLDGLLPAAEPVTAESSTLAAGASEPFTLSLPLDLSTRERLGLPDNGWQVRKLGIAVTGTSDFTTSTLGQLRTFLPWAPRHAIGIGKPTQVAWVWPLIDRPHRSASGVWFDDSLTPEISDGGRLAGLLAAGTAAEDQSPLGHTPKTQNVPVTWAIDPMLVSDVTSMTAGYRVQKGTSTVAGVGTAIAKQWLTGLRTAVTRTDADILPLPYGDPDIVAAARAGGFATTIGIASTTGQQFLRKSLGAVPLLPYGWPSDGLADQRSVNLLSASGDTTMVLSDSAVPVTGGEPSVTPSAHAVVTTNQGPVQALLSDSALDADVEGGVDNPDGSRVSLQEYLAETLMIQVELPTDQRDLVITPNRRWNPTPSYAAALLADTGKVPWIQPVSLSSVSESPIDPKIERDPLTYTDTAQSNELSPSYLAQVTAVRKDIGNFEAIVPQATPAIAAYNTAEQQALSSAWREKRHLGRTELSALSSTVIGEMKQVSITSKGNSYITLTSHGGKVPVTIANNLDVPVSIIVHVEKNQRLSLPDNGQVRVIPAHQQMAIDLHASAKTSGVFPLKVQLLTPAGHKYGPSVQLFVRSTVYGTITLVITGAATAALLIAVAIRLTRRALAARRPSAATGT